jgi:uncharacterized protein YlxW (UPF0749 family)
MTNQDVAFITVCGLFVAAVIHLLQAWRSTNQYRRRAIAAEFEVRRLAKHAACAQAEIRALEARLLEVNHGD